jgi:hypothetical protein
MTFDFTDLLWLVLIVSWLISDGYEWNKDRQCARSCSPMAGQCIDSACHCKTATGWERK